MRLVIDGKGSISEHKGGAIRVGQSVFTASLFNELAGGQVVDSKEKGAKEIALLKKLHITKDNRAANTKGRKS